MSVQDDDDGKMCVGWVDAVAVMEVTAADIDGVDAVAFLEQLRSHDGAQRPTEEEANRCIIVVIVLEEEIKRGQELVTK